MEMKKPRTCVAVTLRPNRRKFARKITIGMAACSMLVFTAVVKSRAP
jgi:hypothetical protein